MRQSSKTSARPRWVRRFLPGRFASGRARPGETAAPGGSSGPAHSSTRIDPSDPVDASGSTGKFEALLMVVPGPIAAVIIRLAVTPAREYCVGAGGALLAGDPLALASTLREIDVGTMEFPRAPRRPPDLGRPSDDRLWPCRGLHPAVADPPAGRRATPQAESTGWLPPLTAVHCRQLTNCPQERAPGSSPPCVSPSPPSASPQPGREGGGLSIKARLLPGDGELARGPRNGKGTACNERGVCRLRRWS